MEQAILDACEGIPLNEVESLTLDSKCKSASFVGLEGCVQLQDLSANNCGIVNFEGFPALPSLTKLELSDNRISGGLSALAGLTSLTELTLAGNSIADVKELAAIKHLPLTVLDLAGCPCSEDSQEYRDEVFDMFPSLQALDGKDREGEELDLGSDDEEDEDDEDEDEEEEEDDEEEEDEDDDDDEDEDDLDEDDDDPVEISDDEEEEEEEEEESDDDAEPGLAALVGEPLDDDENEGDFQAESDPESEDFDEEDEEDDEGAAAKKPRTE